MCLDYVTSGGDLGKILHNLNFMKKANVWGLPLKIEKSKIICEDATVRGTILFALPDAQVILPEELTLLRHALGGIPSVDASLKEKTL